jgi:GNAT superfamily N-acetyltransferase
MREQPPTIRPATDEDVPAIASIILELGWFKSANEEHIRRHLAMCNADDSHTVLVAESPHGKVSGYIAVHWLPYLILPGTEGFVSEMFVGQNERRKGYGRSLIEAVKALAIEKGCIRLALLNSRNRPSCSASTTGGWAGSSGRRWPTSSTRWGTSRAVTVPAASPCSFPVRGPAVSVGCRAL